MIKVARIIDGVCAAGIGLSCVLILFQFLIVNADVIMRYFLGNPILWAQEVSEYALLYLTFLGTAWVLKRGGHIRVELLFNKLSPRSQALVDSLLFLVGAIIAALLVWYGAQTTLKYYQEDMRGYSLMEFPLAPVLLIIPLGSLLFLAQSLLKVYQCLAKWINLSRS